MRLQLYIKVARTIARSPIFIILFLLLTSFQNCQINTSTSSPTSSQESQLHSPQSLLLNGTKESEANTEMGGVGNGDGYDGKLTFANFATQCSPNLLTPSDLIVVSDLNAKLGMLVMQNCEKLATPKPIDTSSLLPYNEGLMLPGNRIFDRIEPNKTSFAPKDISGLVCRATNLAGQLSDNPSRSPSQNVTLNIDVQLSRLFMKANPGTGVSSPTRLFKVSLGIYAPGANNSKPTLIRKVNNHGIEFDETRIRTFKPLEFMNEYQPHTTLRWGQPVYTLGPYVSEWDDLDGHHYRVKFYLLAAQHGFGNFEEGAIYFKGNTIEIDHKTVLGVGTTDLLKCFTE